VSTEPGQLQAQRVNATFRGDASGVAGRGVGALRGHRINGCCASVVGKQPLARMVRPPIQAQGAQQSRREQRIAILGTLALAHFQTHALGRALDVGQLHGAQLRHTQAGGIGDGEKRASAQGAGGCEQARDLFAREDLRQAFGHLGHRDVEAHIGLAQHAAIQEAEGAGGLVHA
jgi:hypothetical protein